MSWRERDGRQIRNAAILLVSACVVGGGWYLYRYLTVGNLSSPMTSWPCSSMVPSDADHHSVGLAAYCAASAS